MELEQKTLATELLHEVKATGKRWFIAFMIMVALEVATIFGFLWYITLPVEDYSTQITQDSSEDSNNIIVGGDSYGGKTDDNENL